MLLQEKWIKGMLWLLISCYLAACGSSSTTVEENLDLKTLYAEEGVEGCFLLRALKSDQLYVYNSRRCERPFLPASTFKIVNAMIALETGVAPDENLVIPWDSVKRQFEAWNQDHSLKTAFQASSVPYYQEIARRIGVERMQSEVQRLQFGKMDIHADNLTSFWLTGNSRITPYEQLDFLTRFAQKELPIKPSTHQKMNDIMIMASGEDGLVMRGKTGWAIVEDRNIGWLVGYLERSDGERFVFVNNIECKVGTLPDDVFMASRKRIVGKVLQRLGVI
ncbi:MAG: penicillin-binding transpeptidase domain-containing protein [Aureispira sp.]